MTSTPASSCFFHSKKAESNGSQTFDASHSPRYLQETSQPTSVVISSGRIRLCVIVRTDLKNAILRHCPRKLGYHICLIFGIRLLLLHVIAVLIQRLFQVS